MHFCCKLANAAKYKFFGVICFASKTVKLMNIFCFCSLFRCFSYKINHLYIQMTTLVKDTIIGHFIVKSFG